MIYLIGGRNEESFSIAGNNPYYDFKYYGGIQRLRQKTRNREGVSLSNEALGQGERLESEGEISD
jgi:hypothetical protein